MKKKGFVFFLVLLCICERGFAQTYPPSSVITMPYNNAYFKEGTDVEIQAYATDIGKSAHNGTISKVEFYNGTTLLGSTTTHTNSTYKFAWKCVTAGTYTVKAKATNDKGVSFTSTGVIITVGNEDVTPIGMSACKGKYLANTIAKAPPSNFNRYWNGVTSENGCIWQSVENIRNSFNWVNADVSYNYAKDHHLLFRYHAVIMAQQYPAWLPLLKTNDAKTEVVEYMTAIADHFPLADQVDVLNDQLGNHQANNQMFRNLFGGGSNVSLTDFEWQIWLFQQARQLFPNTKLILSDYGLENDTTAISAQLELLKALRDRGLVDGFGTQAQSFTIDSLSPSFLKSSLDKMAGAGIPIYATELSLNGGQANDTNATAQLTSYQNHFPVYWEHPALAGITLLGYVNGTSWIGGTGLVSSEGIEKPSMIWLKDYLASKGNVGYPFCASGACTSTDLDDSAAKGVSSAYPNPFHNALTVVQKGVFEYQIVNAAGELVESGSGNGEAKVGQNISKGLYLLKVIHEGNSKIFKLNKE